MPPADTRGESLRYFQRLRKAAVGLLAGVLFVFCTGSLAAAPTPSDSTFSHIYSRATLRFSLVDFFKPAETNIDEAAFRLAPLLLQEVKTNGTKKASGLLQPPGDEAAPGMLTLTNGTLEFDRSQPVIYVITDTVELNAIPHPQLTYLWFYSAGVDSKPVTLVVQGVRITLSSGGAPVLWEELAQDSDVAVLYAAESLEAAARAQFGGALPGRKYALERSLREAPEAVAARVIDDGPMPMGPMLYLEAGTHHLNTLICRCMPAQADAVSVTRTYQLIACSSTDSLLEQARARCRNHTAFWPGNPQSGQALQRRLRLPVKGW